MNAIEHCLKESLKSYGLNPKEWAVCLENSARLAEIESHTVCAFENVAIKNGKDPEPILKGRAFVRIKNSVVSVDWLDLEYCDSY